MGISKTIIIPCLKKGTKIGICNYNSNKRKIIQLSINGDFIKEWDSISEASRCLNIKNIGYSCQDKYGNVGGYNWMYKEDYENNIK